MRALVLGAGGMLGRDLVQTAPPEITVLALDRSQLDITDTGSVAASVEQLYPDVIINAAAYTAVDQAEAAQGEAFRVNAGAVGKLAAIAAGAGVHLVHFSTDYVFDGAANQPYGEDSATNPINTYGASKHAGELALRRSGADFLIIRTQWLFGLHGRSFPRTMWARAQEGLATRVVNDQIGCPTYTVDLAEATWKLIDTRVTNLVHVVNHGQATWYDVARHIFARADVGHLLTPCLTRDYPTPARRPRYSVLSTELLQRILGARLPEWRDALDRFLSTSTRRAQPHAR